MSLSTLKNSGYPWAIEAAEMRDALEIMQKDYMSAFIKYGAKSVKEAQEEYDNMYPSLKKFKEWNEKE